MMRLVFYDWQAPPKPAETNQWKDVGRMGKDERKLGSWGLKFESIAEHTCIHQIPDSFIPFSSSPQKHPKPLAPQDPSHFCRAFFCILKHFRWNLLRIHLCAMLLICYQELCPTIQMRSKSLQKTGILDSMIIWTVDFNTPLKQIQLISLMNS